MSVDPLYEPRAFVPPEKIDTSSEWIKGRIPENIIKDALKEKNSATPNLNLNDKKWEKATVSSQKIEIAKEISKLSMAGLYRAPLDYDINVETAKVSELRNIINQFVQTDSSIFGLLETKPIEVLKDRDILVYRSFDQLKAVRLGSVLGKGGFGVVYDAEMIDDKLAIKFPHINPDELKKQINILINQEVDHLNKEIETIESKSQDIQPNSIEGEKLTRLKEKKEKKIRQLEAREIVESKIKKEAISKLIQADKFTEEVKQEANNLKNILGKHREIEGLSKLYKVFDGKYNKGVLMEKAPADGTKLDRFCYLYAEDEKKKFVQSGAINLIKGLRYMHVNNHRHGDIKPENIYVFKDRMALGDFGDVGVSGKNPSAWSPGYFPLDNTYKQSDIFALGLSISEMALRATYVTGDLKELKEQGFPNKKQIQELIQKIETCLEQKDFPKVFIDQVKGLMDPDPLKRETFFAEYADTLFTESEKQTLFPMKG